MSDSHRLLKQLLSDSESVVMGILNVTPDSFYDGGAYTRQQACLQQIRSMVRDGAHIIDVGGESTRPGASEVSVADEIQRVLPVIELIRSETDIPISIDTSKPEVMRAAVSAGAGMINDVRALREPGALETAAELSVPVCLMHMQGEPRSMQQQPIYNDVVDEVYAFLDERVRACENAGIPRKNIVVDPGFGFGKTLEHNLLLFKNLAVFQQLEVPLLIGVSRKTMIGTMLDKPVNERLHGSLAMAALGCWLGAKILRVHDVAETRDALRVCDAVKRI